MTKMFMKEKEYQNSTVEALAVIMFIVMLAVALITKTTLDIVRELNNNTNAIMTYILCEEVEENTFSWNWYGYRGGFHAKCNRNNTSLSDM